MKILLVCMEFEYGDRTRGRSFEYYNFYDSLRDLGHEVILFDFMSEMGSTDKGAMNAKLLQLAQAEKPAFALFSLYTDQFEPETVRQMAQFTKTVCFFHDDTWRVEFSQSWAPHFDYFTTPDVYGVHRYERMGYSNAVYFPFGCNTHLYHPVETEKVYDVSFVGAWHPYREWLLGRLTRAGFNVKAFGFRWPAGPLSHDEMVAVFSKSHINLNMSNSASWDARYLLTSPRGLINRVRSPKTGEQLKARHFEICGSGGFQLSYYVDGLERHYEIGKELAIYLDPNDLVEKVRRYLSDDAEREAIAKAGYARTLRDHTFKARFDHLFERMGLTDERV